MRMQGVKISNFEAQQTKLNETYREQSRRNSSVCKLAEHNKQLSISISIAGLKPATLLRFSSPTAARILAERALRLATGGVRVRTVFLLAPKT
jgi:hypothetical protein